MSGLAVQLDQSVLKSNVKTYGLELLSFAIRAGKSVEIWCMAGKMNVHVLTFPLIMTRTSSFGLAGPDKWKAS